MSTPIRQEVSPEDPKFYAPPRWRRGEVVAPSIQPSLRSTEFLWPAGLSRLDVAAWR